uniref:Uncharacterized protein n=1 Tax=Chromera velia CCMP2878 TaxID=1169474 RepID=A0A0G4GZ05_9ALVE|eukprot:Cvel_23972.t1-p1 / transcript=Cvel_23972.t1 / gene=Cvel_23972 / organism=Chromera_velia_CCMP2878 / gene_product=hypothetical protein / transcript_product=hypothetical protein / location=Cvel_scaffold2537:9469-9906(-) / protein_length=146 / sequence_SO=supercontig / SO=protein_coding / is_pseudo=false
MVNSLGNLMEMMLLSLSCLSLFYAFIDRVLPTAHRTPSIWDFDVRCSIPSGKHEFLSSSRSFEERVPSPCVSRARLFAVPLASVQQGGGQVDEGRQEMETLHYFQICEHIAAKDVADTVVRFHVFAPSDDAVFDLMQKEDGCCLKN